MTRRTVRRTVRRLRSGGDEGFSMLLAIGLTAAVAGLMGLATASGIQSLRSSAGHTSFEGALAAAEAGLDTTLAAVSTAWNSSPPVDYADTSPCAVSTPAAGATSTPEAERVWARDALLALPVSCTRSTGSGQYVSVRVPGRQVVYALGWHPDRSSPRAERRLLKAEYLFAPYRPTNAILTAGDLEFSGGDVTVTSISGGQAPVHTNEDVTGTAFNTSLNIGGGVSASGTLPGPCPGGVSGGCTAGAPQQAIPVINARSVYVQESAAYGTQWVDLCPDGTARPPSATGVPCSNATTYSTTRGWVFTAGTASTPPTWTLPRTAGGPFPGVYYVFQGNAVIGDNGESTTTWLMTVLAEAQTGVLSTTTCGKRGGDISWKLFNMAPRIPGLMLLADANLSGNSQSSAGSGLFLAGDRVDLRTSNSASITGAVVAGNTCAAQGPNKLQGLTLHYDDSVESPLRDVLRTSLWLEYAAG